jgi:hypothetical protein
MTEVFVVKKDEEEVLVAVKQRFKTQFDGYILETIPNYNFNRLPEVALQTEEVLRWENNFILLRPFMVVNKELFVAGCENRVEPVAQQLIYPAGIFFNTC